MHVVIAGGHGQIALLLERALADRGDRAVGLVRNPDHAADLEAAGAEAVVLDLESTDAVTLATHLTAPTPWCSPRAVARTVGPRARRPSTRVRRSCSPTPPSRPACVAT